MIKIKKICVKYSGYNKYSEYETKELNFNSERDADIFMDDMSKREGIKYLTKIVIWEIAKNEQ